MILFKKISPKSSHTYRAFIIIWLYILFTILVKYYNLKEKERHINIHAIAEEHYKQYYDKEERYIREIHEIKPFVT